MAAPSGTVWGSIVGGYGKLGIYRRVTNNNDGTATARIEIWFASKYSVDDSSNTLYFTDSASPGSATGNYGSVDINTEVASGEGWSTDNHLKLKSWDTTYTRGTSASTRYLYAKLINVDRVGGTMTVSTTLTVPKKPSYTVSYNANGGSGAPASQTKWYGTELTLSSTKPTRTGYTFQGWGTSESDTSVNYAAGASYTANAAITLYAIWTAITYRVTYNANGGTGGPSAQTKTHGVTLTLSSTIPTRDGYDFVGWGVAANATIAVYAPGATFAVNQNTTFYAVWKLSYVKPRVTNFAVDRCDSAGALDDNGTYARVSFSWTCDKTVSTIRIRFESDSGDTKTYDLSKSGTTSGSVDQIIGGGNLDTEKTYSVTLVVTDAQDSSYVFSTLAGTVFAIDFLQGGKGAAFGKPAELENVLDIGFQTRFFGGQLPVVLDPETDLNNVRTPNTYIGANVTTYNYINCPVTSGTFTLIVESCGESGQIRQTYISCSKYKPERFVRFYYQSTWYDWLWAGTEEYVLYESSAGSNGILALNANLSHYRYIEIYFTDNNNKSGGYTKVWSPSGKIACLQITEPSSAPYIRYAHYSLSGNTMVPDTANCGFIKFNSSGTYSITKDSNYIKIVRVIGRA